MPGLWATSSAQPQRHRPLPAHAHAHAHAHCPHPHQPPSSPLPKHPCPNLVAARPAFPRWAVRGGSRGASGISRRAARGAPGPRPQAVGTGTAGCRLCWAYVASSRVSCVVCVGCRVVVCRVGSRQSQSAQSAVAVACTSPLFNESCDSRDC
jgi:hypothetical protein